MNKERRAKIDKAFDRLKDIYEEIESILSEEQDSFDNMPENLQGSARGEESEEAIEILEEANDLIDEAMDKLLEI